MSTTSFTPEKTPIKKSNQVRTTAKTPSYYPDMVAYRKVEPQSRLTVNQFFSDSKSIADSTWKSTRAGYSPNKKS